MSLRHAILGLLARQPSTGYDLTRTFDVSLATTWPASHSQIYPELGKLEGAGLVEVVERGPRGSKTYGLTDAGRDELRRWLVEDEPDRSQRNESGLRLFLTPLLPSQDRRSVLARDLAHVEQQSAILVAIRDQIEEAGRDDPFAAQVDLGIRVNEVISAWLAEQLDRT
ncbi:PadR family transcriptional regulator [Nocardioides sp. SYSU D00038]|uniref:PadR family transcriptional regulator n=1 Tax=Nocardioides sp. SYSU D00038 TaxID=2812554 RepID=UPI00196746F7|nr:PadR family transcriptional regulator [Nocardioides sp. SYSU D00038]